ncbi:MAG TPA: sigma-70 family RNA polymerase sigma factor [Polyangia bacterium]|jgi:RNA polymerase sigma-70 factor (ECF subfamily)|nr:sigma-70 family RNA polymerase sigma factor [Polyangia bacterium]
MTLEQIYGRYVDFVWRTLRRHGVAPDDTNDAIQEVFLTVHRTLGAFEGRSSLPTWLFTICRSVARDRRERAHRRHEVVRSDLSVDDVDVRADAAARLEHNDRLTQLEAILGGMESDLRDVFVLFEIEDLTGDEISAALSVPLGTVYSRLQVARKIFKREVARLEAGRSPHLARAGGRA